MSHTSRHKSQCNNLELVRKTAERLELRHEEVRRYGTKGLGVFFKQWYHPCLFQESGEVLYDSDDARRLADLHRFQQQYQVTAVHTAYPRSRIIETPLENGELELTVQLAGGYAV